MFAFTGWKCCLKHMRVEMPYHEIQKSGTCTADYNTVLGWWWSIHSWRLGHEISSQEVQRRPDRLVCQTRHQLAHQCGLLEGKCVHILEGPFSQDSSVTASILVDTVASVHGISKVNFWTDNAGCYKSSLTFSILYQELGSRLHSFNFCEAQAGKGVCDRKASHLKCSIKRYINEGHDVTCATDMKRVSFWSP